MRPLMRAKAPSSDLPPLTPGETAYVILDSGGLRLTSPALHGALDAAGRKELERFARGEQTSPFLELDTIQMLDGRGAPAMLVVLRSSTRAVLSPRQLEVARMAVVGATAREIAVALQISTNTVRDHLKAAYHRLGVANRVELARAV